MKASPIRILIVDDHFMARLGLTVPINGEPDMCVVAEAEDATEALIQFRKHKPDVVTMDYRLPGKSGAEAVISIRGEFPAARIIMLSAYEGEEDVLRAAQAGVSGYLTKSASRADVLAAIRRVHAGEKAYAPAIAAKLKVQQRREPLIPREVEILRHIVEGRANKEIAAAMHLSEPLVKLHVRKVLEKLGAADRTRAATLAIERGIVHLD
jgi:two-component system NarL family response regulator